MSHHRRAFDRYRRAVLLGLSVPAVIAILCTAVALSGLALRLRAVTTAASLGSMIVFVATHLARLAHHLHVDPDQHAAVPAGANPDRHR